MAYLSIKSPYGDITLFENNDALIALEWGRSPGGQKTPLLLEAQKQLGAYFDGNLSAILQTGLGAYAQDLLWPSRNLWRGRH
jgi:hypothetical protein